MALSNVVTSTITSATRTPSQPGFGTALLAAYFPTSVLGSGRVFEYDGATALDDMVDDGFAVTDTPYLMAQQMLSQDPAPETLKLGRLSNAFTHTVTLKVLSVVVGDTYTITIDGTDVTYTVQSGDDANDVAVALEGDIEAIADISSSVATDTITVTASTAGRMINVKNWCNLFEVKDTTVATDVATDLAAIALEDDDWYALTIDIPSKARLLACAVYAEANDKLAANQTSDTEVASNSVTDDILSTLQDASYNKAFTIVNFKDNKAFAGAAMLGSRLPVTPGSDTWNLKTLAGVTVDDRKSMSATQRGVITAKNGNYYETIAGLNVTQDGRMASGEWADVVRFKDWLDSTLTIRVFGAMVNAQKVPYTDLGTEQLAAQVRGTLQEGVDVGGLKPGFTVTVQPVSAMSSGDRAIRKFGGISWQANLQGAIHKTAIRGLIGV